MMMAFPFTLKGKAKKWINHFPTGSITTWESLKLAFLNEYRPPLKIISQIKLIKNFRQQPNEPLHHSWERFNESLFNCPEHKISKQEQLQIFYQGLDMKTRRKIDFKGPIPKMTPTEGMKVIEELSKHSIRWPNEEETVDKNTNLEHIMDQINNFKNHMNTVTEEVRMAQHKYEIPIEGRITFLEETLNNFINDIGKMGLTKALADLGASISLMPYSMYERLGLDELKPTRMCIELADKSTQYPRGIAENVIIKIDKFIFPVDFVVLDMKEDDNVPLILGRPFLATGHAKIDVLNKKISFEIGNESVTFDVEKSKKYSSNNDDDFLPDEIKNAVIDFIDEVLP
ncbi:reverse transcriptase domain-containing protein [Tanacetum coccineum]